MNIKQDINAIVTVLNPPQPIEKLYAMIKQSATGALVFGEPTAGHGYLQWSLPGADWTPVTSAPAAEYDAIAQTYETAKAAVQSSFPDGHPLRTQVFTVPSNDFIYYRPTGGGYQLGLAAWAYRFPVQPPGGEMRTSVKKEVMQDVRIGFQWDGRLLSGVPFTLNNNRFLTPGGGLYDLGQPIAVGREFDIKLPEHGKSFHLQVTEGQADYIFDLTETFRVEVEVTADGSPVGGKDLTINFDGHPQFLSTDASGRASLSLPLKATATGAVSEQTPCYVSVDSQEQEQLPSPGATLRYVFRLDTPPVKEPETPQKIDVVVEVQRGGSPVPSAICYVTFGGEEHALETDASGRATLQLTEQVDSEGNPLATQPLCTARHGELSQEKQPQRGQTLHFLFTSESEQPEPQWVTIRLKDYGGFPMPNMPFVLTTKKKGRQQLTTDSEGQCRVPKEWFSHKEKINVTFSVTSEYQETHDLHDPKRKK